MTLGRSSLDENGSHPFRCPGGERARGSELIIRGPMPGKARHPVPGGATRRAWSVWPSGPPRTPEGSDPRRAEAPARIDRHPERLPGDEVEIEFGFSPAERHRA